jgi:DNA-binding CsgD family transcriptional regulator
MPLCYSPGTESRSRSGSACHCRRHLPAPRRTGICAAPTPGCASAAWPRPLQRAGPGDRLGHPYPTKTRTAALAADGLSNADIAAELFLSRNTMQTHVSHILAKMGARSRGDIIRHAFARAGGGDVPGPARPEPSASPAGG